MRTIKLSPLKMKTKTEAIELHSSSERCCNCLLWKRRGAQWRGSLPWVPVWSVVLYVCMCMYYMQFNIPSLLDVWETVPVSECTSQDLPAGKGQFWLLLSSKFFLRHSWWRQVLTQSWKRCGNKDNNWTPSMTGIQHVLHNACSYSSLKRIIFPRAAYKNSGVPWSGFKPAFQPNSLHSFQGTVLRATLKAASLGTLNGSLGHTQGDRALYCRLLSLSLHSWG